MLFVHVDSLQVGLDDMIQDGTAGLVKAVERFNPEKVRLQSFAIMGKPPLLLYSPVNSTVLYRWSWSNSLAASHKAACLSSSVGRSFVELKVAYDAWARHLGILLSFRFAVPSLTGKLSMARM